MNPVPWDIVNFSSKHCKYAEEIASFLHQNPQRCLDGRKLHRILSLYEKWWIFIGQFRSEPFERHVLHYIAERAFWSNMKDGDYVVKLLMFLYQADGHFGFFLCPEIDCYPQLVRFNDSNCHLAQFFLHHAYTQKLTISGQRIGDVEVLCRSTWLHPCEMSVITESPAMLRLLLQYGALITDGPVQFPAYPRTGNILVIILCLLKAIVEIYRVAPTRNIEEQQVRTKKFHDMIECARLMMRVCPQFEKAIMYQLPTEFYGFSTADEAFNWVAEHGVPELRYRLFSPMSLKHGCRLKIRKLLHNNWQLPYGLDQLHIPEILKRFINLYFD